LRRRPFLGSALLWPRPKRFQISHH
jgi:hypothetical protein